MTSNTEENVWEHNDQNDGTLEVIPSSTATAGIPQTSPISRMSLFQTPVVQSAPTHTQTTTPLTTLQLTQPGATINSTPSASFLTPVSMQHMPVYTHTPAMTSHLFTPSTTSFMTPPTFRPQTLPFNITPITDSHLQTPLAATTQVTTNTPHPEQWIQEQHQIMMQAIDQWARQSRAAFQAATQQSQITQIPPTWTPTSANMHITSGATPHVHAEPSAGGGGSELIDELSRPYRPRAFTDNSKFTARISQASFPPKIKMPATIGKYDGSTDPDDHLNVFYTAGGVEGWPMPVWCHMFVQTLAGAARVWFDSLPTGEIDSLNDLTEKFSAQFSQQRRHTREIGDVMYIRRRDNESMGDFITRYNKEALQIGGVGEQLLITGFLQGAKSDELRRCLSGRDGMPKKWSDIMSAAKIFAQTEKSISYSHAIDNRTQKKGTI